MSEIRNQPSANRIVAENLGVAALIYLLALATKVALSSDHTAVSPVWPAGGVALAAALVLGWRVFPGIIAPLVWGSVAAGNSWLFSVAAPLAMVLGLYLGRWLLRLRAFEMSMPTTRDVLLLAGLGALLPTGVGGFVTAWCLMFSGQIPPDLLGPVAGLYWVANAAGTMVVAPVLLLMASGRFSPKRIGFGAAATGILQLAAVAAAAWFAFFGKVGAGNLALAYLPFPFLVWMALSRGLGGAAVAVLFTVGMAVFAASQGKGPFVTESALASIWQIEAFIAIITTSGLLIGAGSDAQRREKALQAEAATRKAELERLKAQVNPHFLFNCLTAIHSLIRTDSGAAEEGLTSLSSLLRKSLDVAKHPLIPLAEELEIIRDALRLQKMRYEEGLEWSVAADKAAEEFRVPPMLLQPLVENAVKHGVSDGFGRVDLSAEVEDGDLIVKVRNTAPEDCDPAKWQDSVGLASVRARIAEACPPGSGVEFTKTPDGWIQALVRIKPVG